MAQPKEPPLSVRLPALTLAELRAEAARRKVAVNALIVRAVQKELAMWSDEEAAAMASKPRKPLEIARIPPGPVAWPSGALMEPHHTEDPAPKLALGSSVTFGYTRPKPGERAKKPAKGK